MALNLPETSKEVVSRSKTDVQRELGSSNPFLRNSAILAIITATARRIFDFYFQLSIAIKQLIWSTATDEFLANWASIFGITRNPATTASGNVVATGTASNTIPSGSALQSSDGLTYTTDNAATISAVQLNLTSLTGAGTTAVATTGNAHGLADDLSVLISGADQSEYNGTFIITVTTATQFEYTTLTTITVSPATGTILADVTFASVPITSDGLGADNNQDEGAKLTFTTPIAGVDAEVTVDFEEIAGGTDIEDDEDFKARFLERVQDPVAQFNVAAIVTAAKTVSGVTRVFVEPITPEIGQVTVYFTRDNDASIIPTAPEVADVETAVLAIKPVNTADIDVFVLAPTAVVVNFNFTELEPNTTTMQTAITANLNAFFREQTVVGQTLDQDAYRSAIFNTVDTETGDLVISFMLDDPVGDVIIQSGELPVLGTVNYP